MGQGSIAVNGVSLTVVSVTSGQFSVSLIPHTAKETNLARLKKGDKVNIETDILAKYMQAQVTKWEDNKCLRMSKKLLLI